MGPRPLYRFPSPGWVLPKSRRPSYSAPLANSSIHRNEPLSCPNCASHAALRRHVLICAPLSALFKYGKTVLALAVVKPGMHFTSCAAVTDAPDDGAAGVGLAGVGVGLEGAGVAAFGTQHVIVLGPVHNP